MRWPGAFRTGISIPGLLLLLTASVHAQLPQIRITGVFPPGAQRGTSLDVTVTAGTDLDEASGLVFSHPGLKATAKLDGSGNPISNQFIVSVDPAIEPGLYDVRVRGLFGISNPRIFRVDTISEVQEVEPNNNAEQAQEIALNTVVNARSNTTADVDTFKFAATAGQTVVIRSEAAALDSLMQPVLELFDAGGRRVAHSRRRRQHDAILVFTSPADQTLLLKIHDTVYAGSNDYGYRLIVDTRPQVDFTSPSILPAGTDSVVQLFGRHLPGGQPTELAIDGVPLLQKETTVRLTTPEQRAVGTVSSATSIDSVIYTGVDGNLLPFAIAAGLTQQAEAAPSVKSPDPQTIRLPAAVTGSFAPEMDEDIYRFSSQKGQQWQIDVLADRLGSNADPLLIVEQIQTAADGKETAKRLAREEAGRQNPGGANLPTLTSDPSFLLTTPADGIYQIRLKDRYFASRSEASLTYSVSIQSPKPDYRLVVFDSLPSADGKAPPSTGAISLRKGGTYPIPVYAYRSGGHNGAILIQAAGLPKGVTAAETVIPAGKSSGLLVLTAAADAEESASPVQLTGTSGEGASAITHAAQVTTLVHGGANGLPRTGRISGTLIVGVMKDEEPVHIQPGVVTAEVSQDQQLLIPLKVTRRAGFDNKVDIAFVGQPGNVDVPKVSIEKGKDTAVARFYFKENAAVGPATLLMYATAQVPYRRNPWQVDRAKAKVAAAVEQLEATKKSLADAKAAADAGAKKTAELAAMVKTYEQQLKAEQAMQTKVQNDLRAAIATKAEATKQLLALQEKLNAAAANTKPENENLDAAITAVQEATAAVTLAAKPVTDLSAKLNSLKSQVAARQKTIADRTKQAAMARTAMSAQQKAVEKAKADMAAAEAGLKAREAEKKAADDAVKKAEAASKAQNKNVRVIAVPVRLQVHTTPGKIAAAVPGGGAIKKGTSAEVKVTLTRKNKFAGPAKVSLVLPEGESRVTSNTVEIAADKTEAILKLTATADAAPGDIANAVVRATAEFNGRQAGFDVPVGLKITE